MTFAEHLLACHGYQQEIVMHTSMHRRTAYEVYISRPRKKGDTPLPITKFMPLPIDLERSEKTIKKTDEVRRLMLERLSKEKENVNT